MGCSGSELTLWLARGLIQFGWREDDRPELWCGFFSIAWLRQGEARLQMADVEHDVCQPEQKGRNPCTSGNLGGRTADDFQQTDFLHDVGHAPQHDSDV